MTIFEIIRNMDKVISSLISFEIRQRNILSITNMTHLKE